MNVGSAAVGYGFEYVVSTMDRIKGAALSQDDKQLQMPIITPVADEGWNVKKQWLQKQICRNGDQQKTEELVWKYRQQQQLLASGSDAVILKHPKSVATISK